MNKWIKYALIGGAVYGIYWYWSTNMKKAVVTGGANQGADNLTGQSGENTCKPPREVIQGSCVLRGQGKPPAIAAPKVSPLRPSIVQKGFV